MESINYNWDETNIKNEIDEDKLGSQSTNSKEKNLPSRKSLQIARRLFHMGNGVAIATLYWLSFSHQQMIHALGSIACIVYVLEQIRINYPELSQKLLPVTRFIIRAEEQLKESAMVPYAFAVLLTIITFPKPFALIAIYTLAISDPLSAIVGIKFGNKRIVPHKSLEGSAAFFISTFFITLGILSLYSGEVTFGVVAITICVSLLSSIFEMLPLRIDDNLTIPLFTASILWVLCETFGIYV